MIDKEHEEAVLLRKERTNEKKRKIGVIAKKAFTVGMVSAESPSPMKRVAAGFCKGMADKTNEDGGVIFTAKQGFGTRNHCQAQLVSLAKHAWDGAVWEKNKRELIHELVTSGCTIKPP